MSIVIITYVANAALLSDRNSDAFPLGPYYDTLGDYYVEDPVAEAQSAETDSTDSDYKENEWEHASNMIERQFPESGEWKPNQDKVRINNHLQKERIKLIWIKLTVH